MSCDLVHDEPTPRPVRVATVARPYQLPLDAREARRRAIAEALERLADGA